MKDKYTSDRPMEIAFEFIIICILSVWALFVMSMCGCTDAHLNAFKSGVVSVSECALHTSLGCASQAAWMRNALHDGWVAEIMDNVW